MSAGWTVVTTSPPFDTGSPGVACQTGATGTRNPALTVAELRRVPPGGSLVKVRCMRRTLRVWPAHQAADAHTATLRLGATRTTARRHGPDRGWAPALGAAGRGRARGRSGSPCSPSERMYVQHGLAV
ncbi:hypothetical protein GCM10010507_10490 [Streptomyces cinnamoneus]|uniref:Uncharacterized protein n=1 Tax=Streptomyces cinnamoneus TaxID=53446 RepID=A0A918WFJ9_STRCJ|nr:hypothetical protein GCM10010507_10490 [Streptomyces cinnamoneus]